MSTGVPAEAGTLGRGRSHQDQVCFAGQTCTMGPFSGVGLTINDRVALLAAGSDTCGSYERDPLIASDAYLAVDKYAQTNLSGSEVPYGGRWIMCSPLAGVKKVTSLPPVFSLPPPPRVTNYTLRKKRDLDTCMKQKMQKDMNVKTRKR